MMKIIFNNKVYFFDFNCCFIYFEFTLFLKTFNGGYFLSKVTNNQIVSSKFMQLCYTE